MGNALPPFVNRAKEIGVEYKAEQYPVIFWDLFGEQGHPIRATVAEMGPLLLARLLELNDVQEGVLNILFRYADEQGLLLLDLKDLRALLQELGSNKELQAQLQAAYGNVSPASVGAIQRQLLVLENQGGQNFFGEPALDIADFMRVDDEGRGHINVLAADKLMKSPGFTPPSCSGCSRNCSSSCRKWGIRKAQARLLLRRGTSAVRERTAGPAGFHRAGGAPDPFERRWRLFRHQNPLDVPDKVGAQLGNRVQHALRAFTPREQKAVKAAAETFRPNPKFKTADVITQLGVGEALVSVLEGKGAPSMVERTLVAPPGGRVGPLTPEERKALMRESPFRSKYTDTLDRESAFEMLAKRAEEAAKAAEEAEKGSGGLLDNMLGGILGGSGGSTAGKGKGRQAPSMTEKIVTSAARSVATSVGRQIGTAIVRGVLGGLFGGKR